MVAGEEVAEEAQQRQPGTRAVAVVADASKFLDTFVRTRDPVRGFGTFNGAALSDSEIDQLIESAVIEPVSSVRLEKLREAVVRVGEKSVYLPLFKPSNLALVRDGVAVVTQGLPMLRPQDLRPARQPYFQ